MGRSCYGPWTDECSRFGAVWQANASACVEVPTEDGKWVIEPTSDEEPTDFSGVCRESPRNAGAATLHGATGLDVRIQIKLHSTVHLPKCSPVEF